MIYHVYVDRRADDNVPFYVGKGSTQRIKRLKRNKHHQSIVKKHGVIREIVLSTTDESFAFEQERFLIKEHRTFVYDESYNGVGCNQTFGGDGPAGRKLSLEHRQKLSLRGKNRTWKKLSDETKKKMSLAKLGKRPTLATRQAMSLTKMIKRFRNRSKQWFVAYQLRSLAHRVVKKKEKPMVTSRSESYRQKQRLLHIGRYHTLETKARISALLCGKNNPNYGKVISQATKDKQSIARSKVVEKRSVNSFELLNVYRSVKEAAKALKDEGSNQFDPTGISRAARGKRLQYAGFAWVYSSVVTE